MTFTELRELMARVEAMGHGIEILPSAGGMLRIHLQRNGLPGRDNAKWRDFNPEFLDDVPANVVLELMELQTTASP